MKDHSIQSQTIDILRIICAGMVLVIHSFAISKEPWNTSVYDSIRIILTQGICRTAVPCFFFISGFLFFSSLSEWNWDIWRGKMKRRVHTLLIPFISWGVLMVLYRLFQYWILYHDFAHLREFLSVRGWILTLWNDARFDGFSTVDPARAYPLNYPLWFIRDLILITCITPLIYWFLKRTRLWGLLGLSVFYLTNIWIPLEGFNIEGLFFFSAGALLQMNGYNLILLFSSRKKLFLSLSVVFLFFMFFTFGNHETAHLIFRRLYSVFSVPASFLVVSSLLEIKILQPNALLSESSFIIYSAQAIFIGIFGLFAETVLKGSSSLVLLSRCVFVQVMTFLALVFLYWIMKRYLPRTAAFLTGRSAVSNK